MQKTVIITGATGTLGSQLLKHHLDKKDIVYAMSRCDHKISQSKYHDKAIWCLGDIRNDLTGVLPPKADIVYHCAALKHVHMGEIYPSQYHDVNYSGTLNVFHHVDCKKFVFFSTDKAVLPINFYGMAKALAEKHLLAIRKLTGRDIRVFRWGNIIGSQGSVVSTFIRQLRSVEPFINVTDKYMTRFWLKIEDVINYVVSDDSVGEDGLYIHPDIKAAYVIDVVEAIANVLGVSDYKVREIGIRAGEKIHEHIKSDHVACIRSDRAPKYSMDELTELVRPTVIKYLAEHNV